MMPTSELTTRRHEVLRLALAPLVPYLDDPDVNDLMCNDDGALWVDRHGSPSHVRTGVVLPPDRTLAILRIVATEMDVEFSAKVPSLSGLLPIWGLRVQAAMPPVVKSPVFSFRKPPRRIFTLKDYVAAEILLPAEAEALAAAVRARKSILVSGGPGAGKSTLINALLDELAKLNERVFIAEDVNELQCAAPNKIQLLVKAPTYTWHHAMLDARRFNPQRFILGEVRDGASALELLQIWNSGQPGMATIHGNSTRSALHQVAQYTQQVVLSPPRELIAAVVNVVVHIRTDLSRRGGRSLSGLDQVVGYDERDGWQLEPLTAESLGKGRGANGR